MPFELVLFHTGERFTQLAVEAGIGAVIVDWEQRGKEKRQAGYDTQISIHTLDDLRGARACTMKPIICRVNGFGPWTMDEIDAAVECGADEILLAMVRTLEEVEATLEHVSGRCGLGIMIETVAAVSLVAALSQFPLTRVYVGLNDLSIERRTRHIFVPVADGTVERIREAVGTIPFGFAGLTLPELGYPLPCRLLIAEMARLDCGFTFLRRSFLRDVRERDVAIEVPRILDAIQQARARSAAQVEAEHAELLQAIHQLPDGPWRI